MAGNDDEDKQYEATQKKLDDARKKGEIPKSTDLQTAAGYGGFLLVAVALGGPNLIDLGSLLRDFVEDADTISASIFAGAGQPIVGGMIREVLMTLIPWFGVPALMVLLTIIVQRGLVFAPSKLEFKASRISVLSNAKNKFGRSGLFEFGKSFAKLMIYSTIVGFYLLQSTPEILATVSSSPAMITVVLVQMCVKFMLMVLAISALIGALDYIFQTQEHARKNRMSRKEMMDENKAQEGDPHMKQKRRQKAFDIAMNQMMKDVPDADVIIVNPEHYAVALKWDRKGPAAPICVAKGVDEVAAKIREIAIENSIPIHRDPPVARAIYAVVEIGQEIRPEHYQAVAAAIRFAEKMRAKMRAMGRLKI